MVIDGIDLAGFRNFASFRGRFHSNLNLIYGGNGIGKTNLLESLYFVTHLKSFRTANLSHLIRSESDVPCRISAELGGNGAKEKIEILLGREGRMAWVDGEPLKYASNYLSKVYSVLLATDYLVEYKNEPKSKRKFFDRFCVRLFGGYVNSAKKIAETVRNRNLLIRQKRREEIPVWNRILVRESAEIHRFRKLLAEETNAFLASHYRFLTGKEGELRLVYRSDLKHERMEEEEILSLFETGLEAEILAGYGIRGPHRDKFWFEMDGKKEKTGFSQGEFKSAFLSLQLALVDVLEKRQTDRPVFILDDPFAEIDPPTCGKILGYLRESGRQTFLSSVADVDLETDSCVKIDLEKSGHP